MSVVSEQRDFRDPLRASDVLASVVVGGGEPAVLPVCADGRPGLVSLGCLFATARAGCGPRAGQLAGNQASQRGDAAGGRGTCPCSGVACGSDSAERGRPAPAYPAREVETHHAPDDRGRRAGRGGTGGRGAVGHPSSGLGGCGGPGRHLVGRAGRLRGLSLEQLSLGGATGFGRGPSRSHAPAARDNRRPHSFARHGIVRHDRAVCGRSWSAVRSTSRFRC